MVCKRKKSKQSEHTIPAFNRLENIPLHEKVFQEVRRALMAGRFRPGHPITIRRLAEALGTSPMPVREALTQLVVMQALALMPNRTLMVPPMTRSKFKDLSDIRAILEGMAAERAAAALSSAKPTSSDPGCAKNKLRGSAAQD